VGGDIGPIGPQGEQGDPGQQGPAGVDGENGNANIKSSDWFQVAGSAWSGYSSKKIAYAISSEEITQDIYDNGMLLVYQRRGMGSAYLLPTVFADGFVLDYWFQMVSLTLQMFKQDDSIFTSTITPFDFRYILVPGGQLTSKGKTKNEIKKMTYKEVMDHFGLEH